MFFSKFRDMILGIAVDIIAVIYLIIGSQIVSRVKTTIDIDARYIPRILGIVMLILGTLLIVRGIRQAKVFNKDEAVKEKNDVSAILMTFALIIIYVALLVPLGFLLSSSLYLFCQMMVLAPKGKRNILVFAIVAVGFSIFTYYAFRYGLDLMLPQGVLPI